MRLRRLVTFVVTLPFALSTLPFSAQALTNANVGISVLTYVCPTPFQINFSWTPAPNGVFYSLQLAGPLDPAINGGVGGAYIRQFGTIEVAKGAINSASVSLSQAAAANPSFQQWQVMAGGPNGYLGLIPRAQVALVPVPCTQTTPQQSPYF
ncbi:MAG: hypothetical protein ACHQ7M_04785 [Chloroflexota bacterium]